MSTSVLIWGVLVVAFGFEGPETAAHLDEAVVQLARLFQFLHRVVTLPGRLGPAREEEEVG
jgi:hypothetical protein